MLRSRKPTPRENSAGRGLIYIAAAKLYFMIAGAAIEFRLPTLLATSTFGAYKVVSSLVSPLNNVVITGTIQAVARFTAQNPGAAAEIQRSGFRLHLYVGLPVALALVALAPLLAGFFHDAAKTGPIMLAAAIVAGYSFYAVFVGRANGEKRFGHQAGLDVCFATLRALGILGLASAGFGLYGAIGGWVAAVALILLVAPFIVGLPGRRSDAAARQPLRPLLRFFGGVFVYLIFLNFIMVVDQLLLKRLAGEWFVAHRGDTAAFVAEVTPFWLERALGSLDPARAADTQVAFYAAVQNLARLSYQAIIAATFVIFPLISHSTFVSDRDATHRYVRSTLRYSALFATALAALFVANPADLLAIPYPPAYAEAGAAALVALALGNVAFSLLVISGTILNGAGKTRAAILMAGVTLAAAAIGNAVVIPLYAPGPTLLFACASATAAAMGLGAAVGAVFLARALGATLPLATVARLTAAVAAVAALGRLWKTTGLMVIAESAALGLVFLAVLALTRELKIDDLRALRGAKS